MTFRRGEKRHLVFTANRWVMIGLLALAVSMVAAVLLVCDFLFDSTLATIVAAGLGALYIGPVVRLPAHAPSAHGESRVAPRA